ISPSNFVLTNPELLRETLSSNAENFGGGLPILVEELQGSRRTLQVRQFQSFQVRCGPNLPVHSGQVRFHYQFVALIPFEPTKKQVMKIPLFAVPPWINKFYILDLTPEKSFIKWCVDQGITVFVLSWVNPDARLAKKSFEQYMREGVIEALDKIELATGEKQVNALGYCVGGTLRSITLAYLAAKKKKRVKSATFFAAQVDFSNAGDLMVFVDEDRIQQLETHMKQQGYLEASRMANTFNMLRSNDLIWPYIVNNYMRGKKPLPFDILYWNSDATRMPAANHSYYLRNCYLDNK